MDAGSFLLPVIEIVMDNTSGCSLLADRALVKISGPDAASFLQNLVTCDIDRLATGMASHGALLTPQGKILFEFIVIREADGFVFDLPTSCSADFVKRIGFYRLRAKVSVEPDRQNRTVHAVWGKAPESDVFSIVDPRLAAMGWRIYGDVSAQSLSGNYDTHRITFGIAEGGKDYAFGEVFPHEALLDQTGGVAFTKGCYVGQEIVSRMQHRGTARSRFIMVSGENALPPMGTPVLAGEKNVGTLGSSTGNNGLALLRLDRVKEALDCGLELMAGTVSMKATIQPFATFGWPQESTA